MSILAIALESQLNIQKKLDMTNASTYEQEKKILQTKIKSADKKSNTNNEQDSKASRNIPQNIKDKKLPLKDKIKLTKPKEQ